MNALLDSIDIRVTSRHGLDERLEAAVEILKERAMRTPTRGILVTRIEPGYYTAALSDQVPFGLTREAIR